MQSKKNPLISLIIVNYNGVQFLQKLLKSMRDQSYSPIEIIFVDCSSTDNSIHYVKTHFPDITVVRCANRGFGYGANCGVKKAKGIYIALFNSDMYIPKDFTNRMIRAFEKQKTISGEKIVIGCKIIPFDSKPRDTEPYYGGTFDLFGFPQNALCAKDTFMINGNPFFMERALYIKTKGFNPLIFLYGEDAEYCWRLTLLGFTMHVTHTTWIAHYGSASIGKVLTPKKMSYVIFGTFAPLFINYHSITLFFITFLYIPFFIFLHGVLFLYGKGDLRYNKEVFSIFAQFLRKNEEWRSLRSFTQKNRKVSERIILGKLRIFPSILTNYIRRKRT